MTDVEQVPPARDLPPERKAALRDLLVAEISGPRPWWRRSRRLALSSVIGGTTVVLAGSAAAAYVAFKPATDQYSVVCYSAPQLEDAGKVRVATASQDASDGRSRPPARITEPLAECAGLWQVGVLRTGSERPAAVRPNAEADVPALVACTLDDNTAGVFPGDAETCQRLGLPRTPLAVHPDDQAVQVNGTTPDPPASEKLSGRSGPDGD